VTESITQILVRWSDGDPAAINELMPLVYDELRRLARSHLRRERHNFTLQPTALVHEAYLRLVDQKQVNWENRAQFFGLAARLMRNILVDHAASDARPSGRAWITQSRSARLTASTSGQRLICWRLTAR
jgi:RNA polymerase sigma factor (TIGR02999 family)